MRNCVGNLFRVVNSIVNISSAELSKGLSQFAFMYASQSKVFLSNFSLLDMSFADAGGLFTVTDHSYVFWRNASLRGLASTEQGLISVQQSTMQTDNFNVANFNVSLIDAEYSTFSLLSLRVERGLTTENWERQALLPDGGLLKCLNCLVVVLKDAVISEVSAKEGGVLYLYGDAGGSVMLANSTFSSCFAKTQGGVVSISTYSLSVTDCRFVNNTASSGGVINAVSVQPSSSIANSLFQQNSAQIDGSCLRWVQTQPAFLNNTLSDNVATYGNPQASSPRYLYSMNASLWPANLSYVGVTGQQMKEPLVIGLFDALGQLVRTDNSSVVFFSTDKQLNISGSTQIVAQQGVASFAVLFTPFTVGPIDITVSGEDSNVQPYTFTYSLRDCEAGEIRSSRGCFPCPKNSYSFSPDDKDCHLCMEQAECWGQIDVRLFPDNWRSNNLTDDIYECIHSEACLGGINSNCAKGYEGALCGACASGHYKWAMWECRDCQDEVPLEMRGALISFLVLTSVILPHGLVVRPGGLWFNVAWFQRALVNYAQMMGHVVLIHAKWSFPSLVFVETLQSVGSFGSIFLYLECRMQGIKTSPFYVRLVATAMFPILLFAASMLVWVVKKLLRGASCQFAFTSFAISLYHFVPVLLLMSAASLQCTRVGDSHWLVRDLHEECYTGEHLRYSLSVSIPLLILSLFTYAFCATHMMRSANHSAWAELRRYFCAGYKPNAQTWERVLMLRWIVVAAVTLFFPQLDFLSEVLLLAGLIGLCVALESKRMPYQHQWMNATNLTLQGGVFLYLLVVMCTSDEAVTAMGLLFLAVVLVMGTASSIKYRSTEDSVYPMRESGNNLRDSLPPHMNSMVDLLNSSSEIVAPLPSLVDSKVS